MSREATDLVLGLAEPDQEEYRAAHRPSEAEVRASVRRVIDHAESIWDEWAWQVENQTWDVLGYAGWDEMRRGEYGALTSITAPRAERPELVSRFRNAGLTQQQTAATLGIGQATVARHDEPTYKPRETNIHMDIQAEPGDIVDAELVEDDMPISPSTSKARPRGDAETFLNSVESLAAKAAREAQNLTADQIRRVKPKADLWTVGLRNSIEALQRLVDSLDPEENQ